MGALSKYGAPIIRFVWDWDPQIVKSLINERVLHVDNLASQRNYEADKLKVVPSANAGTQPNAVVIKSDDAGLTIITMATARGWSKDIAAVAVSHLFENGLSRILQHIKYLFAIDVQKIVTHANWLENAILEVDGITRIAGVICYS